MMDRLIAQGAEGTGAEVVAGAHSRAAIPDCLEDLLEDLYDMRAMIVAPLLSAFPETRQVVSIVSWNISLVNATAVVCSPSASHAVYSLP